MTEGTDPTELALSTGPPFKRGFLWGEVGGAAQVWTAGWSTDHIAGKTFRYHPLSPYLVGQTSAARVHCLGLICDVFNPQLGDGEVVQNLAEALTTGWVAFYAALKTTGGAYVLLVQTDRLYVILDACGTVPVVHGGGALASHPRLIAEGRGFQISELAKGWMENPRIRAGGRYMPGLLTPYQEIEMVMPNHRLDVSSGEMDRFYPDADFRVVDAEEIIGRVTPALIDQLSRLAHPLAISLSGGVDSRLTLAASRSISNDVLYFTYYGQPAHHEDLKIARELALRLGLHHQPCRLLDWPATETFADQFCLETDGLQGSANTTFCFANAIGGSRLHIRSNVLETVRGYFLRNPANRKTSFNAATLHRLFRRGSPLEFVTHFQDYIDRTAFDESSFRGFHYTDMFYWEHRMGGWLGPMIRGQRAAWETYIIYNCRALLELMMSRPVEDRTSARIVTLLMREMWPQVVDMPAFSGSKFVDLHVADSVASSGTQGIRLPAPRRRWSRTAVRRSTRRA